MGLFCVHYLYICGCGCGQAANTAKARRTYVTFCWISTCTFSSTSTHVHVRTPQYGGGVYKDRIAQLQEKCHVIIKVNNDVRAHTGAPTSEANVFPKT